MTEAPRPIVTRPPAPPALRVLSRDALALKERLELTNQHCRGIADVLEVYIESCRTHGVPGAAKAIESAVGHLVLVARMNERVLSNLEREKPHG